MMKKLKKKIKKMINKYKPKIRFYTFRFLNRVFMLLPLNEKKVLFLSDEREVLGGNLECIYNRVGGGSNYKRKLILKKNTFERRKFSEKLNLIYQLSTSKYIILDDWSKPVCWMERRKKQEIVQLWHGAGAFKTFGFSRVDRQKKINIYSMHRNYTKAIVTSDDIKWCYAEGFGMPEENIRATGFPRMDIMFDEKYKSEVRKKFFKEHKELKNKKIILFAPTYRGVNLKKSYYDFDMLDLDKLKNELEKKGYVFIIKWHPAIESKLERGNLQFDISKYEGFVYDFSSSRDINDLLMVTDILITDYSSVIFDYFLLDKPVIYYTYDLEKYNEERGLYYDFEDYVYGSVASDMDELIKCIKHPKMFENKRKQFNKKFMSACDGKSTEKTYNYIFNDESDV